MSDFVRQPLQKKLNRKNIISRLDKALRQGGARPSASVGNVYELGGSLFENGNVDEEGISFVANEFPNETPYIKFLKNDTMKLFGEIIGQWLGEDVNIWMRARQISSSDTSLVTLIAGDSDGNILGEFQLSSQGVATLDLRDGTVLTLGTQALNIHAQTSDTNNMQNVLYLSAYSTGTPANSFGASTNFRAENGSSIITNLGSIGFEWVDNTSGSEKARLRVQAMRGGALEDHLISTTYTPALTNVTNIAASALNGNSMYIRVGDIVHVAGSVDIDPTATGAIELGIALPIASALTGAQQVAGTAVSVGVTQSAAIDADITNDRARLRSVTTDAANRTWSFHFTYRIL